jgi:protein-L-isoaspartate(D-aspartate) O-methyltransferase
MEEVVMRMIIVFWLLGLLGYTAGTTGCRVPADRSVEPTRQSGAPEDPYRGEREAMVRDQIASRGVRDPRVLSAMGKVPRHRFVPPADLSEAYADHPIPIGYSQTISQPYIVAFMTEALQLKGGEKVLEIGTGSGYQAAVLGEIAGQVFSIEIVAPLADQARQVLAELGYNNIEVRQGDGYQGWKEQAPFDAVMVTAAPDHVPQPLIDQLKVGGRLIIPVGVAFQDLYVIEKTDKGIRRYSVLPVRFVPMTGEAQKKIP